MTPFGFECVVRALRVGKRLQREGWREIYIEYDSSSEAIFMYSDDSRKPYSASSRDILATDWIVMEKKD